MTVNGRTTAHRLVDRYWDAYEFCKWLVSRQQRQKAKALPFRVWISLSRKGFLPGRYALYRLDKNNWNLFVSDRQALKTARINGEYGIILHDKMLFELVMQRFIDVPRNFALVHGGKVIWLDGEQRKDHDLLSFVREKERVIIKPTDKNGGAGIRLIEYREGGYWEKGGRIDHPSLKAIFFDSGDIIISEVIRQGAYGRNLYPDTVNTIRLLTMLNPESQIPFVCAATQRIGCARSSPVDNVASGGMVCNIDLETGRLGKASRLYMDEPFRWIDRHPETGVRFEDQVVPDWKDLCKKMTDLAEKFPMLPYIAWDVAVLDKGVAVLEGNRWSEISGFQVKQPLLEDPRARHFFEFHNIR